MARTHHSERYKKLRERLLDLREKKGLTQNELARRLGKPQSYISKYESGERRLDVLELVDVAQVLGVTITQIVRGL